MFVAISQFVVANDMQDDVLRAFQQRPHLVDNATGFVRMEVLRPQDDPRAFWLLTWWNSEDAYQRWHRGTDHQQSHAGIPKGLKLLRGHTQITLLERVAD